MSTETKLVLRRFRPQVKDGQPLSSLTRPSTHDLETTLPPASAPIEDQVAYFRSQLKLESRMRKQQRASAAAEASAYLAQAQETHLVEGREINIFAPFVMERSALKTITRGQVIFLGVIAVVLLLALLVSWTATLTALLSITIAFYAGNLLVTFWVSIHTLEESGELQIADEVVQAITGVNWPRYTILCPLYRETEVVAQFADAMKALDYPTDKLQILFLTEADDEATRDAIRAANLPSHFQIITVPDGQPRTKPRACNYGVLEATGDFAVIFDAEDIPDPLQLKKAVLAFASHGPELGCVQAKLNFYNTNQNILTRLFTVEYSTWFDTTLPGLQWGDLSLPLGGTSNHFRMSTLRQIGAWDAFNVTEDCDLGLRLTRQGLKTAVLDSTTYEEANPRVKNWIRQRSRWIKGYMQTYLIHMRQPKRYLKPSRWRELASLQLVVGGRTAVLLINPVMWVMTVIYFLVWPSLQGTYDTLFPALVLYTAVICLIFGNLAYIYTHFIGCLKRRQYGLVKWTLLMPVYWAMTSYAAFKAFKQLITNPHYWEKTTHGLHLNHPAMTGQSDQVLSAEETVLADSIDDEPETVEIAEPLVVPAHEGNGHSNGGNTAIGWIGYAVEDGSDGHNGNVVVEPNGASAAPKASRWQQLRRVVPKDRWLLATIVTACIASVAATLYFLQTRQIMLYGDSYSHLAIARRIYDSLTPGFAQLGGVWLPLPHLLMMPFTAIDPLWRTGLAGACVSMPSYVMSAVYIFLSARRLTRNSAASFIGSLAYILNPNVLYLQTTPLSEVLASATTTAACYYFILWLQNHKHTSLLLLASATFLSTLSRYDGWALFGAFFVLIPLVGFLKRKPRHQLESNTIIFVVFGCVGIAIWLAWNALIFGDPLFFQRSVFSAQAQQASINQAGGLATFENAVESVGVLSRLILFTIGPAVLVLSVLGLGLFLLRKRFSAESLGALVFLVPLAFYLFSLYKGQITILVPELHTAVTRETLFNVRYGIIALPAAALFLALYLASFSSLTNRWLPRLLRLRNIGLRPVALAACTLIIVGQSVLTSLSGVIALQDGQNGLSCLPPEPITDYLARHYDGGEILVDTFYSNAFTGIWSLWPLAGIEMENMIYEGSNKFWHQALNDPSSTVEWVIMDPNADDEVAEQIGTSSLKFRLDFALVLREERGRSLYRRNGLPPLPDRPADLNSLLDNHLCKN